MSPSFVDQKPMQELPDTALAALSARATAFCSGPPDKLWTILSDLWNPETNPEGYVTLGVADNALLQNELVQRISQCSNVPIPFITYNNGPSGSLRCKAAISTFLNRHLDPFKLIDIADLVVTNGVSSAIEHYSWAICDPGDGVLLGRPYYRGFVGDLGLRPNVRVVPVSFGAGDPLDVASPAYNKASKSKQSCLATRTILWAVATQEISFYSS
jgi:1-aminocyclopropane-1-carboxylate synthase